MEWFFFSLAILYSRHYTCTNVQRWVVRHAYIIISVVKLLIFSRIRSSS